MFEATRPISTRPRPDAMRPRPRPDTTRPRPDAMRPRPRPDTTRPRPNNLASRPHRPQHPCVTVCHLTLVRLSNAIVLWGRWLMQALRGAQPSQIFDCWSNRLFCQCLRVFIDANNVGKTPKFLSRNTPTLFYQHPFIFSGITVRKSN